MLIYSYGLWEFSVGKYRQMEIPRNISICCCLWPSWTRFRYLRFTERSAESIPDLLFTCRSGGRICCRMAECMARLPVYSIAFRSPSTLNCSIRDPRTLVDTASRTPSTSPSRTHQSPRPSPAVAIASIACRGTAGLDHVVLRFTWSM